MPPKRKIQLPDHVRGAVLRSVGLAHETSIQADERFKVAIFLATEQGLTTYEIADKLGVSQAVVSKWRRQGEQAERNHRPEPDPDRSAEPVPNG